MKSAKNMEFVVETSAVSLKQHHCMFNLQLTSFTCRPVTVCTSHSYYRLSLLDLFDIPEWNFTEAQTECNSDSTLHLEGWQEGGKVWQLLL